jgi:folate-dependent phosphoribosylglycinamide formyltransferase PurN
LVILLSDNGSNIKSQLEAFKNQISIADDYEKNMVTIPDKSAYSSVKESASNRRFL